MFSARRNKVARELEEMFIFISVDGLQKLKWSLAMAVAGVTFLLTWERQAARAPGGGRLWRGRRPIGGRKSTSFSLRRRRRAAFSEQLVDGLVLMANGMRSGFHAAAGGRHAYRRNACAHVAGI